MEKDRSWLLKLVAGVWALNLGLGMVPGLDYEPSSEVNGIFTLVVTALFVADKVGSPKSRNNDESGDEE